MLLLGPYLPDIFLFIIGFFLLYYAVVDGYDLGVGILSLRSNEEERSLMMGTLDSIWHSNQTWLVLLGGMMFGAFPLFYAIILSSLYIPIMAMLFAFILRGVAIDFYAKSDRKGLWGFSFGMGSLLTTLAQGFALGGLLAGLDVKNGQFVGSIVWSWLNPFSVLVAAGVLFGYIMLGANYLILKTEDELQQRSFRYALASSVLTLMVSVGVYVWLIMRYPNMADKYTSAPGAFYVLLFPALAFFSFVMYFRSLVKRFELAPLLWNVAIILFSFIGVSFGLYPHMIPNVISPTVTVRNAAASVQTLWFMFTFMVVIIPIILIYTGYTNWVFRGKSEGAYGEDGKSH
ncbi:MAG: cytochrome d ubiquinol oxidase subunit II [Desulfoferrobacter sp.]